MYHTRSGGLPSSAPANSAAFNAASAADLVSASAQVCFVDGTSALPRACGATLLVHCQHHFFRRQSRLGPGNTNSLLAHLGHPCPTLCPHAICLLCRSLAFACLSHYQTCRLPRVTSIVPRRRLTCRRPLVGARTVAHPTHQRRARVAKPLHQQACNRCRPTPNISHHSSLRR